MGLTSAQKKRFLNTGLNCHGKKLLIKAVNFIGKTEKAVYKIEIRVMYTGNTLVELTPIYPGSVASSEVSLTSYEYENGGNLYKAAVRAAKEIAAIV